MKTRNLVMGALMTAMVALATAYLKIPSPGNGYMHLGDAVIIAGSFLLGPYAAIPSAVGSALADLLAGYSAYIPATFVIKGILGLFIGLIARKIKFRVLQMSLTAICELVVVLGGYFAYEWVVFGLEMAFVNSAFTLWQCLAGILLGFVFAQVIKRTNAIR